VSIFYPGASPLHDDSSQKCISFLRETLCLTKINISGTLAKFVTQILEESLDYIGSKLVLSLAFIRQGEMERIGHTWTINVGTKGFLCPSLTRNVSFSLTQVSLAQPVADDDTPRNVSPRQGGEETGLLDGQDRALHTSG